MKSLNIDIKTAAKQFGVGPNVLFRKLREAKILHSHERVKNLPYLDYQSRGYFKTAPAQYATGDVRHQCLKTLVTPLGMVFIKEKIIDAMETDEQLLHTQRPGLPSEQSLHQRRA